MTIEPTRPYNVLDTLSQAEWETIGGRFKVAREVKGLTLLEAAEQVGIAHMNAASLEEYERRGHMNANMFIALCQLYGVQMSEIFHGPLPYTTQQEWLDAYNEMAISETQLARGLGIPLVVARRLVQEKGIE